MIVACSQQGDAVASEVLEQGGKDLAYLAGLLIERIRSLECGSAESFEIPNVAIAGSVLSAWTGFGRRCT